MRADRNRMSKEIGGLMREGKKEAAEERQGKVSEMGDEMEALAQEEEKLAR
jgi:seryl-tRNA synthetase